MGVVALLAGSLWQPTCVNPLAAPQTAALAKPGWVSVASFADWLLAADAVAQPLAGAGDTNGLSGPPSGEAPDPASVAFNAATSLFQKHFAEHLQRLNQFSDSLSVATAIARIQSPAQFKTQMNYLDQEASQLAAERAFFLNPAADLARAFRDQGVDPLVITNVTQDYDHRMQPLIPLYAKVFDALSAYLDQTREFLVKMDEDREEWNINADTGLVQFGNSETSAAYTREFSAVGHSAESLKIAFRALNAANPGK